MVYAQTVRRVLTSEEPLVFVNNFTAAITNATVTLAYTLNFAAMGRNFELPQVVEVSLVNE
jgi:hypothetical protein